MNGIREFIEEDIPEVAKLHERVMRGVDRPSSDAKQSYWKNIFFHNPWYDEDFPCLVYQDHQGETVGFLGAIPRRMRLEGSPVKVAVCNHFVVDPRHRGVAGVRLMRRFLSGPQDLSLAEGNLASRRVWEGLGGIALPFYSINWKAPLRPSRYVMHHLAGGEKSALLGLVSWPLSKLVDAVATQVRSSPFHREEPDGSVEDLDAATLDSCLVEATRRQTLQPDYTEHSLSWLLEVLAQKQGRGTLRKVLVRNRADEIVGWFLYYLNPVAVSEVVQIGARDNAMPEVLGHLFHDAWRLGATALGGRIEPRFMPEFSRKSIFLNGGNTWTMADSQDQDLLNAFHRGDAYLTRLEGEWWIPFGVDIPG